MEEEFQFRIEQHDSFQDITYRFPDYLDFLKNQESNTYVQYMTFNIYLLYPVKNIFGNTLEKNEQCRTFLPLYVSNYLNTCNKLWSN